MSGEKTKPANLRPNVMPSDGYMLSVDGKLKTRIRHVGRRYDGWSEAQAGLSGPSGLSV